MWIYNNKEIVDGDVPTEAFGFIYLITNTQNNKKYIGKKFLTMAEKKKPIFKLDGTASKRKTNTRKESNWKNYYGSCNELTQDIKIIGKTHFKREILVFCSNRSTLSYYEAKYQFKYDVLESDNFYNSCIKITSYKKNILKK